MFSVEKKGQVSIEILLLALIIMAISVAVFSYYTQIMSTTNALQTLKIAALDKIAESDQEFVISSVEYKLWGAGVVDFCIFTTWDGTGQDPLTNDDEIKDAIALRTGFDASNIIVFHNHEVC